MNNELVCKLEECETDIEGALERFAGDVGLYMQCLYSFYSDGTMEELEEAIIHKNWDNAFTAAHALKGLAGNMGFVPLFHESAEIVILIRSGKTSELIYTFKRMKKYYNEVTEVIKLYCM